MKFRKEKVYWEIKINKTWYCLCCCVSCGRMSAVKFPKFDLGNVDKKINCCYKPDYWSSESGHSILDSTIIKFIGKWK